MSITETEFAIPGVKEEVHQQIVEQLIRAYWKELETVQNYLACSMNLMGIRAEEIKESLADDVDEELSHAKRLAKRIHVLRGTVPGSMKFQPEQEMLQPSGDNRDVATIIRGVIEAETDAILQYRRIIELCDGFDYVTQDLCISLMSDEEEHRREFHGYLAEYDNRAI